MYSSDDPDSDFVPEQQQQPRQRARKVKIWTAVKRPEPMRVQGAPQRQARPLAEGLSDRVCGLVKKLADYAEAGRGCTPAERAAAQAKLNQLLLKHGMQMVSCVVPGPLPEAYLTGCCCGAG